MAEDRYEKVLLSLIKHHEDRIKKSKRDIKRLNVPYTDPNWSDGNLGKMDTKKEVIKNREVKITTIWVCLTHYRSLLGVNQ
jgi:hypothetical protein